MHHAIEHALRLTDDIRPIRSRLGEDGYYHLRCKSGEKRVIGSGTAHTVLANAGWPSRHKAALLWVAAGCLPPQ